MTKMEPPRAPLDTLKSSSSAMNSTNAKKAVKPFFTVATEVNKGANPQTTKQATPILPPDKHEKSKKLLPPEDMEQFRNEVRGSDLSKVGLTEVLKKKFPQRTAAQIKGTLETYGSRVGKKEVDKRWVLNDEVAP